MRVVDEPLAEGAQPERHHHAVVQDLRRHVRLADVVLEVAHQQQVSGRVEAVVERVVRDVAEHGPRAAPVVAVLVHRHAELLQLLRVVGLRHEIAAAATAAAPSAAGVRGVPRGGEGRGGGERAVRRAGEGGGWMKAWGGSILER